MDNFKQYKRKGLSEMRPYIPGEDLTGISVSDADKALDTLYGGFIARNPKNHSEQWYVAKKYFDENLEETLSEQPVQGYSEEQMGAAYNAGIDEGFERVSAIDNNVKRHYVEFKQFLQSLK